MPEKRTFLIQTLITTLVLNAILLAVMLFAVEGAQDQALLILGVGLLITLVLWFIIYTLGNRLLEQVAQRSLAAAPKREPAPKPAPKPEPVKEAPKPAVDTGKLLAQGAKTGAVQ
ncbi:MAG: hypothetical protein KDE19_18815, partial [Caldilineaceae bacterium]|nr:hypothetical protein [Caldilineaceae bacterium]